MQKPSWKYKRVINQICYRLRKIPFLLKWVKHSIFYIRLIARKGKRVKSDVSVEKIYSEQGKYLYIANPKVATRSVIDYLEEFDRANISCTHLSLADFIKEDPKFCSYYQFSFVRNPWARTYSCWVDKITNQKKFCDMIIISRYKGLYPDMPFSEFVIWLDTEEGQDEFADRHWLSQSKLFESDSMHVSSLFIGKLENIEADFKSVASELSIGPVIMPELNKTQSNILAYQNHYTQSLKEVIARRYKQDIELFDYVF